MKKNVIKDNLRLMVFSSAKELGDKVDQHLLRMYNLDPDKYTFQVNISELWFQDGHQKVEIHDNKVYVDGKEIDSSYASSRSDDFSLSDIVHYHILPSMEGLHHTTLRQSFD